MKRYLPLCATLIVAMPAAAQGRQLRDFNDRSDHYIIGAGVAYLPDYEGSDDYRLIPAVQGMASIHGIGVVTRGPYLYVDVVPRGSSKLDLDIGPIAGVRAGRSHKIRDPVVSLLPKRKTAFELGAFIGVSYHGLTNPYDVLSVRFDVTRDVSGSHKSTLLSPSIDFGTPLSRTTYVVISASANWAGDRFADYYYSIDTADAALTGLPQFYATGGLKNWRLSLIVDRSLTGDLTHGLGLFAALSHSQLSGDFKRSPIVADRGSASQWLGAVGLGYSF